MTTTSTTTSTTETEGYGVAVYESAYALIAKNVFDHNRHAIAILKATPALGTTPLGTWSSSTAGGQLSWSADALHAHVRCARHAQTAMARSCTADPRASTSRIPITRSCIPMGPPSRCAGNPRTGAFASRQRLRALRPVGWDMWTTPRWCRTTLAITSTPLNNTFGATFNDMLVSRPACDFSGDGVPDDFLATGATWWYRSNAFGPHFSSWRYLRTSPMKRDKLIFFGDVNSDGICDVKDNNRGRLPRRRDRRAPPPPSDPVIPYVIGDTLDSGRERARGQPAYTRGTVSYVVDQSCAYIGAGGPSESRRRHPQGSRVRWSISRSGSSRRRPVGRHSKALFPPVERRATATVGWPWSFCF